MNFYQTAGIALVTALLTTTLGHFYLVSKLKEERRHKLVDSLKDDFIEFWYKLNTVYGWLIELEANTEDARGKAICEKLKKSDAELAVAWLNLSPFVSKKVDLAFHNHLNQLIESLEKIHEKTPKQISDLIEDQSAKQDEIKDIIRNEFW